MNNISLFWQWDCIVIQWGGGWASIARWVMGSFQYLPKATSKNIENHEPGERMIWHQSICQNSKHSREAENTVLLDAKKFLGDIDSITLNETSTNVSDHLAGYICHKKKIKLYDECCDQLLLSGEPKSAYIGILSTGGLKNRSSRTRLCGTVTKAFFLLDASSNVISVQHWTQKVPELWYFRNFLIHLWYFVIINVMNLFFIWLTLSTTACLVHKDPNEAAVVKNKVTEFKRNNTRSVLN